jgi:hypothetical protein
LQRNRRLLDKEEERGRETEELNKGRQRKILKKAIIDISSFLFTIRSG